MELHSGENALKGTAHVAGSRVHWHLSLGLGAITATSRGSTARELGLPTAGAAEAGAESAFILNRRAIKALRFAEIMLPLLNQRVVFQPCSLGLAPRSSSPTSNLLSADLLGAGKLKTPS